MARHFDYDVFLSHATADKPRVLRLAEQLREAGLHVWLDAWEIKAGDNIFLQVEKGLETSRVLVLCLSPAALGSGWVELERST
ncbi:MAG: toll/interleukin-1 receptor domain-containing protein, partial [Planctomycetaceae bacterium]